MVHGTSEMTPTLPSDHWSPTNRKVPSHYFMYKSSNRIPSSSSSSMVTVLAEGLSVICESDVLSEQVKVSSPSQMLSLTIEIVPHSGALVVDEKVSGSVPPR